MLKEMHAEGRISEAAILQTCNRLEFYVYSEEGFWGNLLFNSNLSPVFGLTPLIPGVIIAARRKVLMLFSIFSRVTAGLDSQMIGENQILSQVKIRLYTVPRIAG